MRIRQFYAILPITLFVCIACSTEDTFAQGGAVPVRIPTQDSATSRCVNPSTDQIWLTLRRLIVGKTKRFLREDHSVAVLLNAKVSTDSVDRGQVSFPLVSQADIQSMETGQVSIPVEYGVVRGLLLSQDDVRYTGIDFEITIVNQQKRTKWGHALQALVDTADKLPLPASPAKEAATYLLNFANQAVEADLAAQKDREKLKTASLALNFDPTGTCAGGIGSDFESTGTLAVLQGSGVKGSGYVPVNKTNEYCWTTDTRPAFVLKAARKRLGVPCAIEEYEDQYAQVTNDYYAFVLNAIEITDELGAATEADIENALRRCEANGISEADCLKL